MNRFLGISFGEKGSGFCKSRSFFFFEIPASLRSLRETFPYIWILIIKPFFCEGSF